MHFSLARLASGVAGAALAAAPLASAMSVSGTVLVLARDSYGAEVASSGLLGYGIPFESKIVPQEGVELPPLNSSASEGNYGGIIIMSEVSYSYPDGWRSALTPEQFETIFAYQKKFNVRLVRIDAFPNVEFGCTTAIAFAGCCETGVDQLLSFSNTTAFPTAGLKSDAGITTQGLWHYPAVITDSSIAWEVAQFAPAADFTEPTTAAVINKIDGREQFVWFTSWATDWSATSNYIQHAHIHWMTRGLFLGKRKIYLNAQVDDVHLSTGLYYPEGEEFRLRIPDVEAHVTWQADLNSRLPAGSHFFLELAHNGNGDIITATNMEEEELCDPDYAVDYPYPADTPLEFKKPLGTGVDLWPDEFVNYTWSLPCAKLDEFAEWFTVPENRDHFAHLSHTFTHEELNNATYHDASREIYFNQAWQDQVGISSGARFSPQGLVPPAITGLHNGDVIRAWMDNGINRVVGDNTRPPLRNPDNKFWPRITNVEDNGYAGLVIIPRYATTIYYNCDSPECTTKEWIDTSGGAGDFNDLLDNARFVNTRYLFGLQADPYMFHQANMRQDDVEPLTIGDQSGKMSILQAWIEVITQEMTRLTNWPIVSLPHDEIGQYFLDRMARDACSPSFSYQFSDDGSSIVGVVVTTENGNTCDVKVPVTVPGSATAPGSDADKVGDDPEIYWLTMNGSPVTVTLSQPISVDGLGTVPTTPLCKG